MAALPTAAIDVVVTSPPYNLGVDYGTYRDNGPRDEYLQWTAMWGAEVFRLLSPSGSLFLNVGGKPSDQWVPLEVALEFRKLGFVLQNTIHWVKSIALEGQARGQTNGAQRGDGEMISRGHYKPVNSNRYLNQCHEYIFHFTKSGEVELDRLALGVPYQDKSNVTRWTSAAGDLRCRGNSWFIPYETIQNRSADRPHPASFPVRLPEMCILLHGRNRVGCVLDPFLGIGSTALAAVRQRVSVIGYEIDSVYYDTACKRIDAEIERIERTAPVLPLETR